MIDLNDYNKEDGRFDYKQLRADIIENFREVGLKDDALRRSYSAMLSNDEMRNLKIEAIKLNRESFENVQKLGLFSEHKAEKLDKQFLDLINSGLDVTEDELRFNDEALPSLLIQSIQMQDYNRMGMLLAAGAPVRIERDCLEKDTLCALAQVGDINSLLIVLSFLDKPLMEHWLIGYLNSSALDNPKSYIMGEMIARRSEELGDDYDSLMLKSIDSYREKMNFTDYDEEFNK
ncbi:MAG: hypothetical protein IKQ31_04035 [Clostridia bacterium]|nr:hypothetical protein [Clostridia bacterium]